MLLVFFNKIKRLFYAKKVRYTGTLNPLKMVLNPICFGKSTKIAKYLLSSYKNYRILIKLGESINTFDFNGVIVRFFLFNVVIKK